MTEPTPTYYWHVHHDVLCEALNEPLDNRIGYIQAHKPASEIETRLRLLRPCGPGVVAALAEYECVIGAARAVRVAAWDEYERVRTAARVEYERVIGAARAVRVAAWDEYLRVRTAALAEYEHALAEWGRVEAVAVADYDREVERIHTLECPDCPWNGRSIFIALPRRVD